jgi:Tfp pilus assembly protein PilO
MNFSNFSSASGKEQIRNPMLQAVLMIVIVVLFGWFVLSPKYASNSETRDQLSQVKSQRANLEADQQELNRLIAQLESSDEEIKILDEALPLSGRPTRIAILIETFARNSALLVEQLNITGLEEAIASGDKAMLADPYKPGRELRTIDVTVGVTGNTEQFRNFLQLLEQSGRIIDVESLSVTSEENATNFTVRLKTYAFEALSE